MVQSPCVDAGNPASPMITGTTRTDGVQDAGVIDMGYHYSRPSAPPAISITLTPHNPPIQIPAAGGSFLFDVLIENIDTIGGFFNAWTMAILPDSSRYGPIIIRSLYLEAGSSVGRDNLEQSIPGSAPVGVYSYIANVGLYPDNIIDSDSFTFEKLPGDDSPAHDFDWKLFGWNGEEAPVSIHPSSLILHPSSPNPFNPSTVISFELRVASLVKLVVYDIQGREVARLVDGFQPAGTYQRTFDGSQLASGVYFARLTAGDFKQTQKLLLVK